MTLSEAKWDKLLKIGTMGRDDTNSDQYRYPYEPTPYCVLERLADSGLIGTGNVVLDYGCGMGRVDYFLAYQTGAGTVGVEYDARIFHCAEENLNSAVCRDGVKFVLARAEAYPVPAEVDRCYFFNPFSVEILRKTMARILDSYYEQPREMFLFFYYPSDEYVSFLMTVEELGFYDEISCEDLFPGNNVRERILIFSLPEPKNK